MADTLALMSGAMFAVTTGTGEAGIAIGVYSSFPALGLDAPFDPDDPLKLDGYLLRSHSNGVFLVGVTPTAVGHAVWDLLARLGHRRFFPGTNWEIVPSNSAPSVALDEFESPDYRTRSIFEFR